MMGRLLSPEQQEPDRKAEESRHIQPSHSPYMGTNIPLQLQQTILPPIGPTYHSTQANQRPVSSFAKMPPLQDRSHSSFQESLPPQADIKETKNSAVSPTLKLPPILSSKAASAPEVSFAPETPLPPHNSPEVIHLTPMDEDIKCPSLMDMRIAYENMMVSYFMPQSTKSENTPLPENLHLEPLQPQEIQNRSQRNFRTPYGSNSLPLINQIAQISCDDYILSQNMVPQNNYPKSKEQSISVNKLSNGKVSTQTCINPEQVPSSHIVSHHTSKDITSSGCTLLDSMDYNYQQPLESLQREKILKRGDGFDSGSVLSLPSISDEIIQSARNEEQLPPMVGENSVSSMNDMSAVLTELSMFMPEDSNTENTVFTDANSVQVLPTSGTTTNSNSRTTTVNSANYSCQSKPDPSWGRFSVLPPVMPNATCVSDCDNISLMSYNSVPCNAQNNLQSALYYSPFSPFSVNFTDNISSAFAPSPRFSGRSSHSGRGSRNKRALSNSPLSAEGIDLNSIIRMSPTSLVAYINGSRSSSSCVSPGSIGERTGCYGHLSARNSSSTPTSGSNSSGNRRSTSYTPQNSTPGMSNSRSTQSNIASESSNISDSYGDISKPELINVDDNLLMMQAMQELEEGNALNANTCFPFTNNIMHPSQIIPESENLHVLPQDIAAFRTEDFLPYIPPILPPVHSHIQPQYQHIPSQLNTLSPHNKPPPTYDQHMARKAVLQKKSSSDSSQPSNSSSFESSEGEKTVAGSSSTDTESNKIFTCKWLDCTAVFQDQDEFVAHIEKNHIDQKKGDDFICFWKLCPRRLHPFNARYKLLVHMRVHSGDKPNKCTYSGCKKAFSRLENLKIHLRSHTGERPYNCTYPGCTKTFSNSSDRTKHQKTHNDTKPYVCQVPGCSKRYTDPSSLRKHVKKSHPDKKEPERKKIRCGVEELDPKDLNECLMIQAIKPITLCEASPPEPTDSGLGRSPRGSQPASSSDHYPGLIYANDSLTRSETGQGSSSHTSPSSHHSSPPGSIDREKPPPNNNKLRVPILPPIVQSPSAQSATCYQNQNQMSKSTNAGLLVSPIDRTSSRNSSSLEPRTRTSQDAPANRLSELYSSGLTGIHYRAPSLPLPKSLKHQPREGS